MDFLGLWKTADRTTAINKTRNAPANNPTLNKQRFELSIIYAEMSKVYHTKKKNV